jgi:hypothetical protein
MTRYVALLDGKPGAYGVVVPDLPGCTTYRRDHRRGLAADRRGRKIVG